MAEAPPGVREEAQMPGRPAGGPATGWALPRTLWTTLFPRHHLHFPSFWLRCTLSGLLLSLWQGYPLQLTGPHLIPVVPTTCPRFYWQMSLYPYTGHPRGAWLGLFENLAWKWRPLHVCLLNPSQLLGLLQELPHPGTARFGKADCR